MAEFKAFSPSIQVMGQAVMSIVEGMELNQPRALRILAQSGITPLVPERWYPQQSVLDAFKTIFEKIGPNTTRGIGQRIPRAARFPENITTVEAALQSIDAAYRLNHRGALHMGSYTFKAVGPRQARLVCENPYPCAMDMGLIEGTLETFRPKDSIRLFVEHESGPCRSKGGELCSYNVRW